jgi:hypothetical protein
MDTPSHTLIYALTETDLTKAAYVQLKQKRNYGLKQEQHISLTVIFARSIWFRY